MGARSGYTLLTGLFIGLGGMLGLVSGLVQWLPLAVLAPIIVYVALDITVQAFHATPKKHATAVALAFLPSVAYLLAIKFGNPAWIAPERFAALMTTGDGHGLPELATIVVLGNGFIITAMLWASALVAMIDGRHAPRRRDPAGWRRYSTLFGIDAFGGPAAAAIYLPWMLEGLRATMLRGNSPARMRRSRCCWRCCRCSASPQRLRRSHLLGTPETEVADRG